MPINGYYETNWLELDTTILNQMGVLSYFYTINILSFYLTNK